MNLNKEIGGYFGLEINRLHTNLDQNNTVLVNSGRNALRLLIKQLGIKKIFAPAYTCPVVLNALRMENCDITLYHIDEHFYPCQEFPNKSFIIYTNYFGICLSIVKDLARQYPNLIVDNAQAFFSPQYGLASFTSFRKFFGVPDGSSISSSCKLHSPILRDLSFGNCEHLLKRLDVSANFGYPSFLHNENNLASKSIKSISNLTIALMNGIDWTFAKEQRVRNFSFLHAHLKHKNKLSISLLREDVPLVYPFWSSSAQLKDVLLRHSIYIPTYWDAKNLNKFEHNLQTEMIPLPIDQRYDIEDMQLILNVINEEKIK